MTLVHVYPVGDLIEHQIPGGWSGPHDGTRGWQRIHLSPVVEQVAPAPTCPCGPDIDVVDGDVRVTHHSLDARETQEPAAESTP